MALRRIMIYRQDAVLRKTSRAVEHIGRSVRTLLQDMAETMRHEKGIGLAAPQVGILRRTIVLDAGEGILRLVNPVISDARGEQTGYEECLSIPGIRGIVKRPDQVTVQALDECAKPVELTGKGLLARILCHEIDHLDGILFIDRAESGTVIEIRAEGSR